MNNLEEIAFGFRIWEKDNDDQNPMDVLAVRGGAQEFIANGKVAECFLVISNGIDTPKHLVCPEDSRHIEATNWNLSTENISYFIGMDADEANGPQSLLSGDDNLVQHGRPVASGMLSLAGNQTTWTAERHMLSGNVLVSYGLVQSLGKAGFNIPGGTFNYTNRVVIP